MDPKKLAKVLPQQREREQQEELFTTASAEMRKKGASDHSVRIALTGLYTPGLPLSQVSQVSQPVRKPPTPNRRSILRTTPSTRKKFISQLSQLSQPVQQHPTPNMTSMPLHKQHYSCTS